MDTRRGDRKGNDVVKEIDIQYEIYYKIACYASLVLHLVTQYSKIPFVIWVFLSTPADGACQSIHILDLISHKVLFRLLKTFGILCGTSPRTQGKKSSVKGRANQRRSWKQETNNGKQKRETSSCKVIIDGLWRVILPLSKGAEIEFFRQVILFYYPRPAPKCPNIYVIFINATTK